MNSISFTEERPIASNKLENLYKARCQDLQIPCNKRQQIRFNHSCQSHLKNRSFQLKEMGLAEHSARAIGQFLAGNTKIAYLNLSQNFIGNTGAEILSNYLNKNVCLVHLDISNNSISSEGTINFISSLKNHSSLVSVNLGSSESLNRNKICFKAAKALGKYWINTMHQINIANTSIGSKGFEICIGYLKESSKLVSLDSSYNEITDRNIDRLSKILPKTGITRLDLSHNMISNDSANILGNMLEGKSKLFWVNLSSNCFTSSGLAKLLVGIKANSTIQNLILNNNNFSEGLTSVFEECMKVNTTLVKVSLKSCNLKDLSSLKEGLSHSKFIEYINLSENEIGIKGAKDISSFLSKNESLKTLNLAVNSLRSRGAMHIIDSLYRNKTLKHLNLSDNEIGPSVSDAFMNFAYKNKALLSLNLNSNQISKNIIYEINNYLNRNKEFHKRKLIPDLKNKLRVFHTENMRISTVRVSLNRMMRVKFKEESRLLKMKNKYYQVKLEEEKKREKMSKSAIHARSKRDMNNLKLEMLEELIKTDEAKYLEQIERMKEQIAETTNEIRVLETMKRNKKYTSNLKRASLISELKKFEKHANKTNVSFRLANDMLSKLKKDLAVLHYKKGIFHKQTLSENVNMSPTQLRRRNKFFSVMY